MTQAVVSAVTDSLIQCSICGLSSWLISLDPCYWTVAYFFYQCTCMQGLLNHHFSHTPFNNREDY